MNNRNPDLNLKVVALLCSIAAGLPVHRAEGLAPGEGPASSGPPVAGGAPPVLTPAGAVSIALANHPSIRAADSDLEAAGYDREPPGPGSTGLPPSALHINVRADRDVPFGRVQGVLDACVDQGIYRTSLGADPAGP